jgi:hypothetical protein
MQAVKKRQSKLGFQASRENVIGTPFCRWFPNQKNRAPCCGWECLTCGENSADRRWCDSDRKVRGSLPIQRPVPSVFVVTAFAE